VTNLDAAFSQWHFAAVIESLEIKRNSPWLYLFLATAVLSLHLAGCSNSDYPKLEDKILVARYIQEPAVVFQDYYSQPQIVTSMLDRAPVDRNHVCAASDLWVSDAESGAPEDLRLDCLPERLAMLQRRCFSLSGDWSEIECFAQQLGQSNCRRRLKRGYAAKRNRFNASRSIPARPPFPFPPCEWLAVSNEPHYFSGMIETLEIERMSFAERLQAMELLWRSLVAKPDKLASPAWHKRILEKRLAKVEAGKGEFLTLA